MEDEVYEKKLRDLEEQLFDHGDLWWLRTRAIRIRVLAFVDGQIVIRLDVPEGVISEEQEQDFLKTDKGLIQHFVTETTEVLPYALSWTVATFTPPRKPPTNTHPREVDDYALACMAANVELICEAFRIPEPLLMK
jgi:hypothetical protein